jgi:hypothetical protein
MTAEDGESYELLVEQRLGRQGLEVKLDRGFKDGVYAAYVEFDALAGRVGFTAAHRQAAEFCALLKAQLDHHSRHSIGDIEDASRTGDPRRRRDLELTYLAFPILTADGRPHDDVLKEEFRVALLRAGQQWDQAQARAKTHRRHTRREEFRRELGELLDGDAYRGMDDATKERLLEEIPSLVFPPRGPRV